LTTLRRVQLSTKVAAVIAALSVIFAPQAAASAGVAPGKIETLLLSDDDVSSIIGLPLHRVGNISVAPGPANDLGANNECKQFLYSGVNVWSGEFTAFRQVKQQDNPDDLQFAPQQFIGVYPNPQTAIQTFGHSFSPDRISRCNSVVLPDASGNQWSVFAISITGTGATWFNAELQNGQDNTWHCANDVRLKNNVMYQDQECQYGNGSSLAAQMADMTGSRIP
jgi:hypothetical protein